MTILFYDTETTGLPLWSEPSEHPGQPWVVSLSALLTDDEGKKLASMDLMVNPERKFEIPDEVVQIHGITNEQAAATGLPMPLVFKTFLALWEVADRRIGFGESFDARMVRIQLMRLYKDESDEFHDRWKAGKSEDVMKLTTPICKLPPTDKMMAAGRRGYKSPKLTEAFEIIMGEEMKNAHSSMGDVIATKALYFAIKAAS